MARRKAAGKKKKLVAIRKQNAPRWVDIKKFNLKRARTRRVRVPVKHWRRGRQRI